ncbi:MAG: O-antigen ligase family protein [Bacteroidia bacterium]
MLGTVPTSIPQFILLGNWLLEGDFKTKLTRIKNSKLYFVLISIFIIHALGLIYTNNLLDGWNDVRTKLPLFLLPTIYLSSEKLTIKEIHMVLISFLAGTFLNISWCLFHNAFIFQKDDTRELSRFMSHIRLGFLINIAIFISAYFIYYFKKYFFRLLFVFLICYFVFGLIKLGLFTGLINLGVVGILSLLVVIYYINRKAFYSSVITLIILISYLYITTYGFYNSLFAERTTEVNVPQSVTANGNAYNNYRFNQQIENGIIVARNIQSEELIRNWNAKKPDYIINLEKEQNRPLYFILLRYMSSKGLMKDSTDFSKLNNEELNEVANNVTNYLYKEWNPIQKRLYELFYEYNEYKNGGIINGHSFTMRFYYIKAAICAIKQNPIFGCGTGDVQNVMNTCYEQSESPLNQDWRKRPHNQFVTIFVALGLIGLLIFIAFITYPLIRLKSFLHILYWPFLLSAIISFTFEDTLETQTGLSFFAFFNVLFLTQAEFKRKETLRG